ncbi:Transposase (or an inactivated derivative) [Pseudovibrio axinellae]|nr:Transposase (or an inactivated derivative) [Pseudovibrio axinellae]
MSEFKYRQFQGGIILWAVRWYCKYGISCRDLEEMLNERGVDVDHTTLYRWVQHDAPELEKHTLWYQNRLSFSSRVDETYVEVKGQWKYLFRAIDKHGDTIDFLLTSRRDSKAAKRFLAKALRRSKRYVPSRINTDKNPAYGLALAELKREGKTPDYVKLRQVKYLHNRLESDHGKLKRLIEPTLGFQSMRIAAAPLRVLRSCGCSRRGNLMVGSALSAEGLKSPSSTGSLEFTPELRLEEGYLCLNSKDAIER